MGVINTSTLQINLTARDAGLERELNKAKKATSGFQRATRKTAASVNRVGNSATRSGTNIRRYSTEVRRATKSTDLMDRSARRLGSALALAFSVRALARGARTLLRLGTTAEETGAKYREVFGGAVQRVDRFLDKSANKMGLTIVQGQELSATMGAIAQGFGASEVEAAAFAQRIITLGADLASFNNIETADAIDRIRGGITGLTVPLKQLGIVLSKADIDRLALSQTGKKSAAELTKMEQATAGLDLITRLAGRALGDVDRTAGSTANTIKRLTAAYGTLVDDIAREVLPVFASFFRILDENREKIVGLAGTITRAIRTVVQAGGENLADTALLTGGLIGAALGKGIIDALGIAMDRLNLLKLLPEGAPGTRGAAYNLGAAFEALNPIFFINKAASEAAGDAIQFYAQQLRDLASGSQDAYERQQALGRQLRATGSQLTSIAGTPFIIPGIEPGGGGGGNARTPEEIAALKLRAGIQAFKDAEAIRTFQPRAPALSPAEQRTQDFFARRAARELALPFGGAAGTDPLSDEGRRLAAANDANRRFEDQTRKVADIAKFQAEELKKIGVDVGTSLVDGIIDGTLNAGDLLKSAIKRLISVFILTPLFSGLGIFSPSKVTTEVGINIGRGMVKGMNAMEPAVKAATVALVSAATLALPSTALAVDQQVSSVTQAAISVEPASPQINITIPSMFADPATEARSRGSQEYIKEGIRIARDGGFR